MSEPKDFRIEKGIPVQKRKAAWIRYPFEKMEIGDSFFMPTSEGGPYAIRGRASAAIRYWRKSHPQHRFKTLTISDGLRVWRVE